MEDIVRERQQVSPVQSTAAGLAAFIGGDAAHAKVQSTTFRPSKSDQTICAVVQAQQ